MTHDEEASSTNLHDLVHVFGPIKRDFFMSYALDNKWSLWPGQVLNITGFFSSTYQFACNVEPEIGLFKLL